MYCTRTRTLLYSVSNCSIVLLLSFVIVHSSVHLITRSLSRAFKSRDYRLYKRASASTSTYCFALRSLHCLTALSGPDFIRSGPIRRTTYSSFDSFIDSFRPLSPVTDTSHSNILSLNKIIIIIECIYKYL